MLDSVPEGSSTRRAGGGYFVYFSVIVRKSVQKAGENGVKSGQNERKLCVFGGKVGVF